MGPDLYMHIREEGGERPEAGAVRDELDNQVITEEAEDSSEGTDRKTIGDEFYNSPGTDEKIVIASLSVTVTGLLGAAGGGEARLGGGYHHNQQQQQKLVR